MNIIKKHKNVILFDLYGELLTDKQKELFLLYYFDDLSLGEIAQQFEISRQAVYDSIKRTESLLFDYEQKMCLCEKYYKASLICSELKMIVEDSKIPIDEKKVFLRLLEKITDR